MSMQSQAFKPQEHFRNLKGQQYLEVKWRVVWFREEHPEGYIATDLVEHDADGGLAVFKARAGYATSEGRDVYATGYGSETRKDFGDYLEKSETKAIGRALAMLGYGTAQAIELDEGDRVVDSPVDARSAPTKGAARNAPRTPLAVVRQPADVGELRAQVVSMLAGDAEAAAKLPKAPEAMNAEELAKTLAWLTRRARALGRDADPVTPPSPTTAAQSDAERASAALVAEQRAAAANGQTRAQAMEPTPPEIVERWRLIRELQAADPDFDAERFNAALPKKLTKMDAAELDAVIAELREMVAPVAPASPALDPERRSRLNAYVDGVQVIFDKMKGSRGKLTAEQIAALGTVYEQGQMLMNGAVEYKASAVKATELATLIGQLQCRAADELSASQTPAPAADGEEPPF